MRRIILASQSPRRQELLHRIGLEPFDILVPQADESYDPALPPQEIVAAISAKKASAAAVLCESDALIIAADTMVFLDDKRLGKPRDEAEAFAMLSALTGREHLVCTGVTARCGKQVWTEVESTAVRFAPLTSAQIRWYISTGECMDKAGAYGIQGRGALLVESIRGDYFNVMGLPVRRLSRMLTAFGVDLLA